jgi:D-alanyl-lipoteichoic acid acyltransferase DltB (MBOAT superfamily)
MNVAGLQFLLALLLLSAVFFYVPKCQWRQGLLALCNFAFLYPFIPNAISWLALSLFLLSGYLVAHILRKRPSTMLFAAYIVALIAAFGVIRKYDLVTAHLPASFAAHAVTIVGFSYMLFRQIAFLVDAKQGQIERMSLWAYANYQINLFALLSGPIQRYQDFYGHWEKLAPVLEDDHAIQKAYLRLLIGIIKLTVVATAFLSLYNRSADALVLATGGTAKLRSSEIIEHFLGIFYFYPIYLYVNFSGYCDIVIAGASLVGMILPENFDQPYLSRNVIDYWTRWHRTLGFWIRDYLFMPLYMGVARRWPDKADSLAFLCYFAAFFVVGIWHGPTTNFVVFGFLQGLGVSAAKLWERHLLRWRGRGGLKIYLQSPRIRAVAIVGTLHFECFSLLFFPVDLHTTLQILRTVITTLA